MNLPLPNRLSLSLTYLTSHHPPLLITTPHLSSPHSTLIWPHFALPPLLTAFGWWRSNSMWVLDSAVLICQRDQWSINKTLLLEMTKYIIITDLPISKIKHVSKFWRLSDFYLCEQNTFFLHLLAYLPALLPCLSIRLFICMLSRVWDQRSVQT